MIYTYGVSFPGAYHVKNDIPNQDAYKIDECNKTMVIAAVADGLGSAEFSDVASKIAVEKAVSHCKENIAKTENPKELLAVIKESFVCAFNAIESQAKADNNEVQKYDTTLTLAIYCDETLFLGHSGDSGIVALTTDGLYRKATEQQRDENNCVFPLFFQDKWIFEEYPHKVSSVFMATDGMLETLFPLYIRNEEVNIHIALAQFFMDNEKLKIQDRGKDEVESKIGDFVKNIPKEQVDDDKTIVVLINTASKPKLQSDDYYKEPDWAELKRKHDEEWQKLAYPHLFKEKKTDADDSDSKVKEKDSDESAKVDDSKKITGSANSSSPQTANKPKDGDVNESESPNKKKGWMPNLFKK